MSKTKAPAKFREEYERSGVSFLKLGVMLGKIAWAMRECKAECSDIPDFAPAPGFLATDNIESGICKLIRRAVELGWINGDEEFLENVSWREPEKEAYKR